MKKKSRSIAFELKNYVVFIVLVVSCVVIYTNYYILNANFVKIYEINKNRILQQIRLSYLYPIWELDKKNISLISKGYMQSDIVCSIKIISYPGNIVLFEKSKHSCMDVEKRDVDIKFRDKKIGHIVILFSKKIYRSYIKNLLITNISLVFFILILIYFSIDLILKNKLQEPITQLVGAIKKIEKGDYSEFNLMGFFEEFSSIFQSVNVLKDRIKTRETELRQSEEQFRKLAENCPLGILLYQGEKFIYCNRASIDILGYSENELLSMKFWEIVTPDYKDLVRERGINRQRGIKDIPDRYKVEVITKSGENKVLDTVVTLVEIYEKPAGLIIIQDVTEQIKNQQEIERLKNFLQNIVNSMPSVLITVDREFRLIYWNKFLEDFVVKKDINLKDRYLFDVLSHDEKLLEKIKDAFISQETKFYFKSTQEYGKEKYENITIFPVNHNGIEGAVIKIDDITEQIKFEEMLIHSEKMITIGNMAAGIAHEINNPLAIIMQACDVCCKRIEDSDRNREIAELLGIDFDDVRSYLIDRKIDRMLFNIKEATQRAADIIRGLLSFSQASYGKKKDVDLRELMDETILMAYGDYNLEKKYDVRKIKFLKQYEDIPLVECDPVKIKQVFLNIIKNGAQAMAGMEGPRMEIHMSTHKDMVKIQIKDNGPGIPKEIIGNIFDPFYTTRQVGEGVGLGLYISYFIITKQHSGKILVDSYPGKGTTFTIYLPINRYVLPESGKKALSE